MELTIKTYSDTFICEFFGTDDYENFYCFEVTGHLNGSKAVIHIEQSEDLSVSFKRLLLKKFGELKPGKIIEFE